MLVYYDFVAKLSPEATIALWASLWAFIASLIPFALGGILWYANARTKEYAAKRDFDHLRNNQKEISNGIAHLMGEMEDYFRELNRDILEIKLKLNIDAPRPKSRKNKDADYEE
ncbi:hypothetical protein NIES4075_44610 [Tolypothrix sp. NIES-4075]|uniref:hypothetical protein n=1 Tax=Tolypothrix sp. NIES-4075 TaxID=2005459 RepID=UPI000B5C9ABA|nr:hypothetical protein [Tolypothrix sp. NIES-4075]GAX43448.1 hypothetical protein NIES4075_44610 [Tolypothrix sp. NIES-4075]